MNPALAALAAVTIAGAVLAVGARDVRATLLGLLVVLLGAPLVADPWPDPLSILARIAATLLAVRLVAIGLRGEAATGGTRIGWPADTLVAAAAAVVGFGSHGLGAPALGPAEAQATGFALIALAIAPLATGRDALRLAVGALLLLVGAGSVRIALDAPPSQGEHLVGALLTIAIGGAVAVLATAARAAGGLGVIDAGGTGEHRPRLPDAHRPQDARRTPDARRPARAGAGAPAPAPGPRGTARAGTGAPAPAPAPPPGPRGTARRRPRTGSDDPPPGGPE